MKDKWYGRLWIWAKSHSKEIYDLALRMQEFFQKGKEK